MILKPNLVPKLNVEKSTAKLQAKLEYNLLELMNTELERIKSAKTKDEKIEYMSSFDFFAKHHINIKNISSGSIAWSLVFTSVQSLDAFWNEYMSGHLKEMFEKDFITKQLLNEADLEAAELEISVDEEDFNTCKDELMGLFLIFLHLLSTHLKSAVKSTVN